MSRCNVKFLLESGKNFHWNDIDKFRLSQTRQSRSKGDAHYFFRFRFRVGHFEMVTWSNYEKETTIVMRQLSLANSSVFFTKNEISVLFHSLFTPQMWLPTILLISKTKISDERAPFRYHWWHKTKFVKGSVLWIVRESRRQRPMISKWDNKNLTNNMLLFSK